MNKKPLIGVSILAVVLLVLGSLSNVVGYQTNQSQDTSSLFTEMLIGREPINWTINGTMGENGWYVSLILLSCTYDHEIYAHVYYEFDENHSGEYTEPFIIDNQGEIDLLWSAVDYEGNIEEVGSLMFRIDSMPPVGNLTLKRVGLLQWLLVADVDDITSGISRVEFYIDDSLIGSISQTPYEYVWTGFMFIILIKYMVYGDDYLPFIKPYDFAGNTPTNTVMIGTY